MKGGDAILGTHTVSPPPAPGSLRGPWRVLTPMVQAQVERESNPEVARIEADVEAAGRVEHAEERRGAPAVYATGLKLRRGNR